MGVSSGKQSCNRREKSSPACAEAHLASQLHLQRRLAEHQLIGVAGSLVINEKPPLLLLADRATHLPQDAGHFLLEDLPGPLTVHQIPLSCMAPL